MSVSNRLLRQSQRLPKREPLTWRMWFRGAFANDAVLWIAWLLAFASMLFFSQPLSSYPEFIDAKTLACLFSLMVASGGFMLHDVFDAVSAWLVNSCGTTRMLLAAMVGCTFFSSMLITNDVALIVFVPMTLIAFAKTGVNPAFAVVLQTVAANVGSAFLPTGNPQNLYLFSHYAMPFGQFLGAVWPICLAGGALLAAFCLAVPAVDIRQVRVPVPAVSARRTAVYAVLFLAAVLGVFDAVDYRLVCLAALAVMLWKGKSLVQQVDFALLLVFAGLFIFVGNISRVPAFAAWLGELVRPHPYLVALASSQIISNVPAAIMLSGFTEDAPSLLAGVSVGGCGTLIASMASLISYKLYVRAGHARGRFLLVFGAVNIVFVLALTLAWLAVAG